MPGGFPIGFLLGMVGLSFIAMTFVFSISSTSQVVKLQNENKELNEKFDQLEEEFNLVNTTSDDVVYLVIGGSFEDGDVFSDHWSIDGTTLTSYYIPDASGYGISNITSDDVEIPDPMPFLIPDPGYVLLSVCGDGSPASARQIIDWDSSYAGKRFILFGYLGGDRPNDTTILTLTIQLPDETEITLATITVEGEDRDNERKLIFSYFDSYFPHGVPVGSVLNVQVTFTVGGPPDPFIDNKGLADSVGLLVYL